MAKKKVEEAPVSKSALDIIREVAARHAAIFDLKPEDMSVFQKDYILLLVAVGKVVEYAGKLETSCGLLVTQLHDEQTRAASAGTEQKVQVMDYGSDYLVKTPKKEKGKK